MNEMNIIFLKVIREYCRFVYELCPKTLDWKSVYFEAFEVEMFWSCFFFFFFILFDITIFFCSYSTANQGSV